MKCYDLVPLSNITMELESGSRPKGGIVEGQGDVFSIGGEHLDDFGSFNLSSRKLVPDYFFKMMRRGIVKPNDILIVKDGATTGKVSFVLENFPKFPCCINEHVFRLSVKKDFSDARYVFYYLYSPKGNREIMNDFRGATVGGISQEFVEKINIPLPPLPEQRRIAALLAKADRLRRLRRYAMQLGDTYLQSVFLKMFGEHLLHDAKNKFDDVLEIPLVNGVFEYNENYGKGTPVIWVDNLYHTVSINTTNLRRAKLDDNTITKYEVFEGDLLFTRSSLVEEGVGQVNIVPILSERTTFECHTIRARVNQKKVNPYYIVELYRSYFGRALIMQIAKTATMTTIGQGDIRELPCPIPPLTLQERFAGVVRRYEHLRAQQRESARQAGGLFQSLLKSAFEGNL